MKLAPSRDGRRIAAVDGDQVRVLDLSPGTSELAIQLEQVRDLVMFESELWVVAGTPPTVHRYTLDLRLTGSLELPPGRALIRASYGPPAALWTSDRPLMLTSEGGAPVVAPLEIEPATAIHPLTASRLLVVRGGALSLQDASGTEWSEPLGNDRVLALGALSDGRSAVVVVPRRDVDQGQHLILLNLRDGGLQHRLALHGVTGARFAARRSLAVLVAGPRRLILLDMRFGRVLRQYEDPRDILDLAVDDAGEHLVLRLARDGGDEFVDLPIRALISGRIPGAGLADAHEAVDVEVSAAELPLPVAPAPQFPDVPVEAEPGPAPSELPSGALLALRARPPRAACSRDEAIRLLEHYRQLVAALAGRAIARGWDSGTIGFVDESRPPFETEVAALVFGMSGLAAPQLAQAELAVTAADTALRAAESALGGRAAPLQILAEEFELSPLAMRLLILIAAPTMWGELARLYGILANDEHRPMCDELLLHQLGGVTSDRHALSRALDRDQPLVRHGLVAVRGDRARPFAALSVDPLVLWILRADPLVADLDDGTKTVPAGRSIEELRVPAAEVARAIEALQSVPASPARLVVRGRIGSGRRTLVAALAARASRRVGMIDAGRLVREKRIELLPLLLRRSALRGWLPMVDGLDAIGGEDVAMREQVRDALREHPGPLALRLPHDATPPLPPGFVQIDLPTLKIQERAEHWKATLDAAGLAVRDLDALATRFQIGPGVIERVTAQVREKVARGGEIADVGRAIDGEIRQHLESRLGQVASRVTRLANWSQVILPSDIQDSITELIARIRQRRTVYETWGYNAVMSTSRGVTALFQGGPGTGKTMVASAIANDLGLDLYRVDLSRVMSKWIGETEQNLAKVFDAAEEGHAIILFDEADSLFAKRTEVRTSADRYANLEVNYLLQRLDSFEGIAILTTNFGTAIDNAFRRRLSFRLTFPFPDDESRELLWKTHLPDGVPRAGEFDFADLARRFRMSGGYVRNASLRAAFLAAEEGAPLTQDHLERAIRAEFREIGKLGDSGILE
jgi:hypothetical protein